VHLPFSNGGPAKITPLTRVAFVYNGPKRMELAPNPRYSGGSKSSFKLVMPAPKPVREMTQLPRETQKDGDTQTNSETYFCFRGDMSH